MPPSKKKPSAGRPPKFEEVSGPITVTLPHRTLKALEQIDRDRAKAMVKCVDAMTAATLGEHKRVEVIKVCQGYGLIVIGPCPSLANVPGLRLVEIAPLRFLLVITEGCSPYALELAIMDLIERLPPEESEERVLLTELRQQLSLHRRQDGMTTGEILFLNV